MKRLLVLSGKGGTGKTTVSAALIALSKAGAIADCDVDAPNLHLVMQQTETPQITPFMGGEKATVDANACIGCGACAQHCRFGAIRLIDGVAVVNEFSCEGCGVCSRLCASSAIVLAPDMAGEQALYLGTRVFSTATLTMGRGTSGKLVTQVKQAMIKHAGQSELAVVDGSPGIGCPVMASVSGMDAVLIVAEPSKSGMSDLKRLVKTVTSFGVTLAVCVNKYDTSIACTNRIKAFCETEEIAFVGVIPFDKQAIQAVNAGATIVDADCPAGEAVRNIYESLLTLF